MGVQLGSSEGESSLMSEINVTPFVDVVLVLLVIFMVTAPAFMKDTIGIQLPKASASDGKAPTSIGIAVNKQGQFLLNGIPVSPEELTRSVQAEVKTQPDVQAIISADQDARHGDVVKAIDLIKSAGLQKFAIQIQRENSQ